MLGHNEAEDQKLLWWKKMFLHINDSISVFEEKEKDFQLLSL